MNIVILGPGAIGSLWACHLQRSGHRVSLLGKQQCQFHTRRFNGKVYTFPYADTSHLQHADVLLVTLKAWQVEQALIDLKPALATQTVIVLMHNGMGCAEKIAPQYCEHPILLATTTHGAYRPVPDMLEHTGTGQTFVGRITYWVSAALSSQRSFITHLRPWLGQTTLAKNCGKK